MLNECSIFRQKRRSKKFKKETVCKMEHELRDDLMLTNFNRLNDE